jgi:hypothetical protein
LRVVGLARDDTECGVSDPNNDNEKQRPRRRHASGARLSAARSARCGRPAEQAEITRNNPGQDPNINNYQWLVTVIQLSSNLYKSGTEAP